MTDGKDISQAEEKRCQEFLEALNPAINAISEALKNFVEALCPLVKYQMNQIYYIMMMMSEEYKKAAIAELFDIVCKKAESAHKEHQMAVQNRLFN